MIIEQWEVIKYHYVIVFILSVFLVGALIYILKTFKKQTLLKLLTKISVGAIIALTISGTIYLFSFKTIHVIYSYRDEEDLKYFMRNGWELVENSQQYNKAHLQKQYKK